MDSDYPSGNEEKLQFHLRSKKIEENMINLHPHNCIGLIRVRDYKGRVAVANGILISNNMVLTSAHVLFNNTAAEIKLRNPFEFCLNIHRTIRGPQTITVRVSPQFKYPSEYLKISNKMYKYEQDSEEFHKYFLQSAKYDYALLKLETPVYIKNNNYPVLVPTFQQDEKEVTVCGYQEGPIDQFFQMTHSNILEYFQYGGSYNIDTARGQSGSPVFFMEGVGSNQICNLVGVHKGYNEKANLNICTLVTEEVIDNLKKWMVELGIAFRVKRNVKKKKMVSIEKQKIDRSPQKSPKKLFGSYNIAKINEEIKQKEPSYSSNKIISKKQFETFKPQLPQDDKSSHILSSLSFITKSSSQTTSLQKIDSEVLRMKGSISKDIQFISNVLRQPKSLQLLFRASQHNFAAEAFHKKCAHIPDTFVLVRTQFRKTIAGYSHYKWNEPNKYYKGLGYVKDSKRKTFLLQMDLQQILTPVKDYHLIYCNSGLGPVFGGGDLSIVDNCNQQANSTSIVGLTYNIEGSNSYIHQDPTSMEAMSGSKDGKFKVVEYEVFRVIYE